MSKYIEGLSKPIFQKWSDIGKKKPASFKKLNVFKHENIKLVEQPTGYIQLCNCDGCLNLVLNNNMCRIHINGEESYRFCHYKDICTSLANFGHELGKPLFCVNHKDSQMVDVMNKKCQVNDCSLRALYGMPGERATVCSKHKTPLMINRHHTLCQDENCTTLPSYGYPGQKSIYCVLHKKDGMIYTAGNTCKAHGCLVLPSFGIIGSRATHCAAHREDYMIRLYNRCEVTNCLISAGFGYPNEKRRFCLKHKEEGMVVRNKRCETSDCDKAPSYAKLYAKCLSHCRDHATRNEYTKSVRNPVCCIANCSNTAYHYDMLDINLYPVRCNDHALPTDIKLVEKECSKCKDILYIPEPKDECMDCGKYRPQMLHHFKEYIVKGFLQSNNIVHIHNDKITSKGSTYRPDFVIDATFGKIILEVDENQHKLSHEEYTPEKETERMKTIYQDVQIEFPNTQVLFLRYNPDKYTGTKYTTDERLNILYKLLTDFTKCKSINNQLGVIYLFYDGFATENIKLQPIPIEQK